LVAKKQLGYLDNGYSKHVIWDVSKFINLALRHEGFVTYRDNNKGRIIGKGDVGDQDSIIIKDVLLVEGLKHDLLRINQICDKGYNVTFEPELCLISNVVTRKTLLAGTRINNEYMLNIYYITSNLVCLISKSDESWSWHRYIAHIHMHHLNKLVS